MISASSPLSPPTSWGWRAGLPNSACRWNESLSRLTTSAGARTNWRSGELDRSVRATSGFSRTKPPFGSPSTVSSRRSMTATENGAREAFQEPMASTDRKRRPTSKLMRRTPRTRRSAAPWASLQIGAEKATFNLPVESLR